MPYSFRRLRIRDVILVEAQTFKDDRGFFVETYKQSEFAANGIPVAFVQDNYVHSIQGVVRGLHYQIPPKSQAKLIAVARGEIFDVAIDIRSGSPTYGQWVGDILSDKNHHQLFMPVGFAHGYCVTSDWADVSYKVSDEYSPDHERGIAWNDPDVAIPWPVKRPLVSPRDSALPFLSAAEGHFVFQRFLG